MLQLKTSDGKSAFNALVTDVVTELSKVNANNIDTFRIILYVWNSCSVIVLHFHFYLHWTKKIYSEIYIYSEKLLTEQI